MGDTGLVDVLIVTYNSAETVGEAISSVLQSEAVRRVIVVDNASSDESVQAARAAGAATVINSARNTGFAAGVNMAFRRSDAELVLLLNPDAALDPEPLGLLIEALREDDRAVLAGPILVGSDGVECLGARKFSTPLNRVVGHTPLIRKFLHGPEYRAERLVTGDMGPVRVDYLWGAVLLARSSFFREVGGLDERFFLYSEDEDIARAAMATGNHSLLVPRARATHIGAVSSDGKRETIFPREIRANVELLQKWDGRAEAMLYAASIRLALTLEVLAASVRGRHDDRHVALAVLRSIGDRKSRVTATAQE